MLKTISLFSGIGGLDFGFEAAGFDTRVALELDRHACNAMRLNRPSWSVIEGDINDVPSSLILEKAGLMPGEADVLIGGPPCQPFSKAGYWARGDALRLDDPRADTLTGYLRVLRDVRPRAFLLENVYGLAYQGKDEGLRHILEGIEQINRDTGTNYKVTWKVVNCAEYGVPQTRERVFLIGSRDGRAFTFPAPTHAKPADIEQNLFCDLEPYRTAWDAIGDLPEPTADEAGLKVGGKWGDLLPSIPEGENYLWHTSRGGGLPLFGWRTRYWSFLLKLSKRMPSWTIQAQPGSSIGPFHWNNRRLSFQELCRLQTFPDGLRLECGRTEVQRMLGNAVPSLVAEVLARAIRAQLLDSPPKGRLKLIPPRREYVPPAVPCAPVAAKYHAFIGDHAAHPGTGKGRLAVKQKTASI
ncbi:DNA cytosine methyltransferase [Pseudomonas aeruginosa]|uniref:Cytosine-specific methyltransferase n=1 Tax=Pseudomonas aeruginosa TaxID=287 RepID=A0A6A9JUP4_PSEAI|nr:DNA cytosine methyltransferase [Pseudomonas aeruginosa]MUI58915.1 DNA (cytosine-5-)-methyltransferase [Pseudomonas aeruginosa]HBP5038444.1 DNA cytosine methyltransferase [Pseudomonas aeruginosa]HCD6617310.1 DNA (cytosine-5-)-methyltransferase [Pseudomonas aeruginosa]HCF5951863.1 DNA (cytosine-5-)-methyltransferase [Pseudomonas aeruginosa]HCG0887964.1 DNA (cytosine-5-)-methyltransferase [Pseudomonas aeruginosa]